MYEGIAANAAVCLLVGGALNGVLVYLILRRKNNEMRTFSRILLQTCVVDLIYLVYNFLVQPVAYINNEGMLYLVVGWLRFLPSFFSFLAILGWFFLSKLCLFSITALFVYRYLVFCRDMRPSHWIFLLIVSVIALFPLINIILGMGNAYATDEGVQIARVAFSISSDYSVGYFLSFTTPPRWTALIDYAVTYNYLNIAAYVVILLTGFRIWWCIRQQTKCIATNRNILSSNAQVFNALVVQASIPLFYVLLPHVNPYVLNLFQITALSALQCNVVVYNWIPILTALCTLLIVTPYRRFIFRHVKWHRKERSVIPVANITHGSYTKALVL